MAMIIVAVGLEDAFRVKLEEEDATRLVTVGDLARLVVQRVAQLAEPALSPGSSAPRCPRSRSG